MTWSSKRILIALMLYIYVQRNIYLRTQVVDMSRLILKNFEKHSCAKRSKNNKKNYFRCAAKNITGNRVNKFAA